jgi:hypothetical protein
VTHPKLQRLDGEPVLTSERQANMIVLQLVEMLIIAITDLMMLFVRAAIAIIRRPIILIMLVCILYLVGSYVGILPSAYQP